jgi:hypothetical protein
VAHDSLIAAYVVRQVKVIHHDRLRAIRRARGFALLIQPWPPADKYPKPSRIVMARYLGQLPKRVAYQLQLPLMGGY